MSQESMMAQAQEPLWSPAVAAVVNLKIFHERIAAEENALFKKHGLSAPKYNLLRILRSSEGHVLTCSEISRRMVHRVPDVTRLVNRLEEDGFVRRRRSEQDGRVVMVELLPHAVELLGRLDQPVLEYTSRVVAGFGDDRLSRFLELLVEGLGDEAVQPTQAERFQEVVPESPQLSMQEG